MGGVFLATIKSKLNYKERALVAVSSFSKGTITATLGGMVLSQMKTKGAGFEEYQQYGSQIQTVSVLAIMILAPVSSVLISALGPKLLEHDSQYQNQVVSNTEKVELDMEVEAIEQVHDQTDMKIKLRQQRLKEIDDIKIQNQNKLEEEKIQEALEGKKPKAHHHNYERLNHSIDIRPDAI